jgi:hypothetical protein
LITIRFTAALGAGEALAEAAVSLLAWMLVSGLVFPGTESGVESPWVSLLE